MRPFVRGGIGLDLCGVLTSSENLVCSNMYRTTRKALVVGLDIYLLAINQKPLFSRFLLFPFCRGF